MISDKIMNVQKLLALMADPVMASPPSRQVLQIAANRLNEAARDVKRLEAMVVPRRQRLIAADLPKNVKLFPMIPRPEAGIR